MKEIKNGQFWINDKGKVIEILDIAGSFITVECIKTANVFSIDSDTLRSEYKQR